MVGLGISGCHQLGISVSALRIKRTPSVPLHHGLHGKNGASGSVFHGLPAISASWGLLNPTPSMYGIFTYMDGWFLMVKYGKWQGKYTIHGCYGNHQNRQHWQRLPRLFHTTSPGISWLLRMMFLKFKIPKLILRYTMIHLHFRSSYEEWISQKSKTPGIWLLFVLNGWLVAKEHFSH